MVRREFDSERASSCCGPVRRCLKHAGTESTRRIQVSLRVAGRQRLGNLEKKSQIATGESKSSPASGMACPPFCTENKMTTGVPSFTQVRVSTEVRPPLCG